MTAPSILCITAAAPGRPEEFLERCHYYVDRFEKPWARCDIYHKIARGPSMPENVINLLGEAKAYEYVVIIEDDDWYGPEYLREMVTSMELSEAHIIGANPSMYYHIKERSYRVLRSYTHCSMYTTIGRAASLVPLLRNACQEALNKETPSVDLILWRQLLKTSTKIPFVQTVCPHTVGIKHNFGRCLGKGHTATTTFTPDPDYEWLEGVIGGEDLDFYQTLTDKYNSSEPNSIDDTDMEEVL